MRKEEKWFDDDDGEGENRRRRAVAGGARRNSEVAEGLGFGEGVSGSEGGEGRVRSNEDGWVSLYIYFSENYNQLPYYLFLITFLAQSLYILLYLFLFILT